MMLKVKAKNPIAAAKNMIEAGIKKANVYEAGNLHYGRIICIRYGLILIIR